MIGEYYDGCGGSGSFAMGVKECASLHFEDADELGFTGIYGDGPT